jgi:RES domain-containing protein
MPLVWRLAPSEFARKLDGEGSRLFGARWTSRGRTAVYTSSYLSLAMLEVYVNIAQELRDHLPVLQAVRLAIPDDASATQVSQEQLGTLMTEPDATAASRRVGDGWLDQGDTLVLEVPSILVPEESNLVLNPAHPRMREVKIISTRAFHFDPRLVVPRA